jgi:HTH-type transcriptional repressor of NAD biosynthesis genes
LTEQYNGIMVAEYLRTFAQKIWDTQKRPVSLEDIALLISGQFGEQQKALDLAREHGTDKSVAPVFMDTNIEQLEVYFDYYFGNNWGKIPAHMFAQTDRVIYILTQPDMPWQADDLRDRPLEREALFSIFRAYLDNNGLCYQVVYGSHKQRMNQACQFINKTWPNLHV